MIAQPVDGEALPIPNTDSQECSGQDRAVISEEELLGRGHRQKKTSILLRDYVTHSIQKLSPSSSTLIPQRSSRSPYLIAHYVNCNNFSLRHRLFLAGIHVE